MYKYLLFLLILSPISLLAQVKISGKVSDITTHAPIDNASVLLSNSTVGNRTDSTGNFVLSNVKPGQYDLVVSKVGFETYHLTLMVTNSNLTVPPIEVLPKSITLNEVVITPDAEWVRNFDIFKTELLGDGPEAKQCKILNPDVVRLKFNSNTNTLEGSSEDFMDIQNKALGYNIKYLLTRFSKDYTKGILYYEGSVLFQDMPSSSPDQIERWKKAREKAYYGSMQHFLRSALRNHTDEDGFKALQMVKIPNPNRPSDDQIKTKLAYFNIINSYSRANEDSIYKWENKKRMSKTVFSVIQNPPVNPFKLTRRTSHTGVYMMSYTDYLYVMYTKTLDNSSNSLVYRPPNTPNYSTSILTFSEKDVLFDDNGTVMNAMSLITEGAWTKNRMSGMLPVDYEPEHVQ